MQKAIKLTESLVFFELCHTSHAFVYQGEKTVFQNIVDHLSVKLALKTGENDCVVLYTSVTYLDSQGQDRSKALSMVKIGNTDYSAMAQTVSIPLATLT